MKIVDRLHTRGGPLFSFEFFPPKTEAGVRNLFDTLKDLAELKPAFVSVTYGAGGSMRQRTIEIATHVKREAGIEPMAHLACIGHTRREIREILDHLRDEDIENVLCLRGDLPHNQVGQHRKINDFRFASDLIAFVRGGSWDFCLGGACYPEKHLESLSLQDDIHAIKIKVETGAQFLITQLFFDNIFYFDFVRRAAAEGIEVPIIPGIMPITNYEQIDRFTKMCGATIPDRLRREVERYQDDHEALIQLGVAHATMQCQDLLANGAPGIHFYTLNRSRATRMILMALRSGG